MVNFQSYKEGSNQNSQFRITLSATIPDSFTYVLLYSRIAIVQFVKSLAMGSIPGMGTSFSLSHYIHTDSRTHTYLQSTLAWEKRPGREADSSPSSTAECMEVYFQIPICLQGVVFIRTGGFIFYPYVNNT
jgi:hypothetical protein